MSSRPEPVSPELLRSWGLPDPGDSKKSRGDVVVVGGSRRSPGAVVLAAEAALRVGAGRVALIVPQSIEIAVGLAIPEAGVYGMPGQTDAPFPDDVRDHLASADAVLVGPGFADPENTLASLRAVADSAPARVVLDAFALGVLDEVDRSLLPEELLLSPNREELELLLGREAADEDDDVREAARTRRAAVGCYGSMAHPDGRAWRIDEGGAGLGTSGSGDVLAGAITGFLARGLPAERALVWGAWAHARAGASLTERVGMGFLARDLAVALTPAVRETLEG
ncbi:NAD(P)H-hydrate dehydratase [Microbacterium insulae]|uniref:ADP-dependent (S)-NAD(P)H-hydrate dehydratase n=1 Tax=Microbacterium insulae TaxID=483014 RepID=A0ABW3AFN0_9MICO